MQEITYESILPLVVEAKQEQHFMSCLFRCPLSAFHIRARSVLRHASLGEELMSTTEIHRGSANAGLMGFLRRVFGGAGEGARGAAPDGETPAVYTEEEKEMAVVEAFREVSSSFVWEGSGQRWISAQAGADLLPEFNQQLAVAPVVAQKDRDVLARMLVEIARADGTFAAEERTFLREVLGDDEGRVEALLEAPPLSAAEMAACGALLVRETMLMLAWATSLVDGDLDPQEAALLANYAQWLSVRGGRAEELRRYAQIFLVDQALEYAYEGGPGGAKRHAEAFALAERLGLDRANVQRVDMRLRKRLGRL